MPFVPFAQLSIAFIGFVQEVLEVTEGALELFFAKRGHLGVIGLIIVAMRGNFIQVP